MVTKRLFALVSVGILAFGLATGTLAAASYSRESKTTAATAFNPRVGAPEEWDDFSMYAPNVIFDAGIYKMWYSAANMVNLSAIGYATSPDGISWTRYPGNPVLQKGLSGAWDAKEIGQPSVVVQGGVYKMWYFGSDINGVNRIGYATSPDGIHWTKYAGNPVITVGAPGSWDDVEAGGPRVVYEGGSYHMWYHGFDGSSYFRIGYATSPDGMTWTKDPGNPVFGPGPSGMWDENSYIWFTSILLDTGHFDMWYTANGIGYVTSTNGIDWNRFLSDPVLTVGDPTDWDGDFIMSPTVVHQGGLYRMWYSGFLNSVPGIGYATSPDGITWTKYPGNPVFVLGTPGEYLFLPIVMRK